MALRLDLFGFGGRNFFLGSGGWRPCSPFETLAKTIQLLPVFAPSLFLEKRGNSSSAQCVFRRSHSTLDALIQIEAVCDYFLRKQHFITVFFDLEKILLATQDHENPAYYESSSASGLDDAYDEKSCIPKPLG